MPKVTAASVRGSAWPERLGHLLGGSWGCGWGGQGLSLYQETASSPLSGKAMRPRNTAIT